MADFQHHHSNAPSCHGALVVVLILDHRPPSATHGSCHRTKLSRRPSARPEKNRSVPDGRRWQELSALAEAHILCPQLCGGVRGAMEDGQNGTTACDRRRLDVVPGPETRHRTVGSSIMMVWLGQSLGLTSFFRPTSERPCFVNTVERFWFVWDVGCRQLHNVCLLCFWLCCITASTWGHLVYLLAVEHEESDHGCGGDVTCRSLASAVLSLDWRYPGLHARISLRGFHQPTYEAGTYAQGCCVHRDTDSRTRREIKNEDKWCSLLYYKRWLRVNSRCFVYPREPELSSASNRLKRQHKT